MTGTDSEKKVGLIKAFLHECSATVNYLAERDGWPIIRFEVGGEIYQANSYWAATDWLKSRGLDRAPHTWLDLPEQDQ